VEDGQPFPELKKLLEAAKAGAGGAKTFALVGRAWLQMWRDQHATDKPATHPIGSPVGSLLLLGCPHHQAGQQHQQQQQRRRRGAGKGEEQEEQEAGAGRLNLPLYLHDLLERGVVSPAGLKEVGGWWMVLGCERER
jgi:hypothetical protein